MKSARKCVQVLLVLVTLCSANDVWAGGSWEVRIPDSQPDLTALFDFLKEIRQGFQDYSEARMPLEQREAWAKRIVEVCRATKPGAAENTKLYVHACYECTTYLSSMNMGEKRFEMCQEVVAGCLPYVDAVPVSLAIDVVTQMSHSLDLNSDPLTPRTAATYRNTFVEYRLRVWRRIVEEIDPTWKQDDPNNTVYGNMSPPGHTYPSGIAPEAIKEPEIRQAYEKMLAENNRRAKRNVQQHFARQNADRFMSELNRSIPHKYERFPVTDGDWEMLRAYLRIYVSDDTFRQELYAKCRKAAGATGL